MTAPLTARGWLDGDRLTPAGAAAHAVLTEKVQAQRRRVTNGIVDAEYLQTVDVLRRMAANLGRRTQMTPLCDHPGAVVTQRSRPPRSAAPGEVSGATCPARPEVSARRWIGTAGRRRYRDSTASPAGLLGGAVRS
ncbi:hypothetical protein [Streptomyces sp. SID13031]|uniref:hypothetical protein n=1 Tax=Streptomyces sp. SID13031 TaxID=2706046 RepID=UPI0013CD6525|nr:hypothetical protein [Streptomyces sp. SID13031]NEA33240.1 hypothetical protein [Streptomyces sp. SID13031]